jgi:hypothetical protein
MVRPHDLEVNAGATSIRIRTRKREVALELCSKRVTPRELRGIIEADANRYEDYLRKKLVKKGPRELIEGSGIGVNSVVRFEEGRGRKRCLLLKPAGGGKGLGFDIREWVREGVIGAAVEHCSDDEGRISLLDFRNMQSYVEGGLMKIRDGIHYGEHHLHFGAFLQDPARASFRLDL